MKFKTDEMLTEEKAAFYLTTLCRMRYDDALDIVKQLVRVSNYGCTPIVLAKELLDRALGIGRGKGQ